MSVTLDSSLCKELADSIEILTHTGLKSLDSMVMKKVKRICKLSDGYVEQAHHLVMFQLGRQHSEIRFSAFQIIDELFRRSHCFRELLVSNMQHLMELAVETSPDHPLPPPRTAALNLKRMALRCIREWNSEFGDGYKKLKLGYNYLKHCKKVDFSALEMEDSAQRMRQQELERRQNTINQERLKKVQSELEELRPEINATLTAMDNCFGLLLPAPENFFIVDENPVDEKNCSKSSDMPSTSSIICNNAKKEESNSEEETDEEEENFIEMKSHGIFNPNFKIELELKPETTSIKETSENAAIFENVRDLNTLIRNRYLPCVKKWEQMMSKCSGSPELLKHVINLKQSLEVALKKFSQLNIKSNSLTEGDSSDSDFEEVEEKEGYEEKETLPEFLPPLVPTKVPTANRTKKSEKGWSIWSKENDEKDPTSAQSTLAALAPPVKPAENKEQVQVVQKQTTPVDPQPSTSSGTDRKSKLLAVAPKLPFDVDLYHWEDENITAPTMLSVKPEGARFWSATSNDDLQEIPVPEGVASLRTRVIEFSGKYEPVKWACRAPMRSGKLCPRRDRYKCPFHGPIVPRDETGKCTNPEDAARLEQKAEEEQRECPDWQDPQLLADIKMFTRFIRSIDGLTTLLSIVFYLTVSKIY
ncbi:UV-stimulated scaffold protein A isoform X2 [Anabrus simplex]|uniref:UV-stimulated scaffold protein A isoform X2 n=1 Tax=Anabrus simplex TaxID=316456 RepID=UPI0035A3B61B